MIAKKRKEPTEVIPTADWETEKLFVEGDEYFEHLISHIRAAEKSVDLESYIYENDVLGERVANALCEAAGRGVAVRALVDGIGSPHWESRYAEQFTKSKAQYRTYHRILFSSKTGGRENGSRLSQLLRRLRNLNRRNHRKLFIVDGKHVWVGSLNVSAVHLRSVYKERAWRDTGLYVQGEGVELLELAFERAWLPWRARRGVHTQAIWRYPSNLVRLNGNRRLRKRNYRDLVKRLSNATRRIWITTPYFVPTGDVLEALGQAAKRGVDVKILVPSISDVFFMPWVAAAFMWGLQRGGAKIFRYRPRILHAKTLLIDNWATVGSSNFNHRSIFHDLEVDVVLSKKESVDELASAFEKDLTESDEFTAKNWSIFSSLTSRMGRCLLLFRSWL